MMPENFLDLHDVIFNELIGDIWLTIIIGLIVIFFLSIRFKMPFEQFIIFGVLWLSIMFAAYTGMIIIWVFIGLIIGLIFYYAMAKAMKR